MTSRSPLLRVSGLRTEFATREGVLPAVADVSFDLARGEVLGLVGESGSGKSVTGFSILGLIDPPGRIAAGSIVFDGMELVGAAPESLRRLRGKRIAMIFQDPMMTLNPVLSIETQMVETVLAHDDTPRAAARQRAIEALGQVGIAAAAERIDQYPHQFSGGMRQRVAIAIALLHKPDLIIADEPTTALDVTVQARILDLIGELQRRRRTSVLYISHDLSLVRRICDRVAVMYAGRIVEIGDTEALFADPRHPYTRGLLAALPAAGVPRGQLAAIRGTVPELVDPPAACRFVGRCPSAQPACEAHDPALQDVGTGHSVACFLHHPPPAGDAVSLERRA
jgi:peptide/nickel transport system ATP-binding protein